jgi:hypothetical protein
MGVSSFVPLLIKPLPPAIASRGGASGSRTKLSPIDSTYLDELLAANQDLISSHAAWRAKSTTQAPNPEPPHVIYGCSRD